MKVGHIYMSNRVVPRLMSRPFFEGIEAFFIDFFQNEGGLVHARSIK